MAPSYIASDALAPVPEEMAKDIKEDYMEPAIGVYQKEGSLYGVAMEYNLEYGGMIVNKNLFDEAKLSYPTTWEELRKVSQDVSVSNGDVVEMEGFEMMDGDSLFCNYLAMILQQGGQYLNEDGSINFASPEGVKALEEILSMVDNGETDLENLVNGEYCFNDVYQGKGYMASVGSGELEKLELMNLNMEKILNMYQFHSMVKKWRLQLKPDGELWFLKIVQM